MFRILSKIMFVANALENVNKPTVVDLDAASF